MADEQAPPVVSVVVTSDPGPWLEECLRSLLLQDYANQAVLVVDAASADPVAPRVAAIAPDLYLRRLEENRGFGPSANVLLETVEGAALYLLCHDDVILEPDALSRMVEESFRSNAAIVGPKLVAVGDPGRLLQLGVDVDRFGAPVRRVERGELDQSQHDESREVFAVPGACELVRADLFTALHGFDPEMTMFGEDVDLCWRARLAGARVVVAPAARVQHHEATASRQRPLPDARALQWRHELRAVLKNYGTLRRAAVVLQLLALSLAEIVYFSILGRRRRAREVVDAWRWNFGPERNLAKARADVAAVRRQSDRVVCRLFTGRSFRSWRFVRTGLEEFLRRESGLLLHPVRSPGSRNGHRRAGHGMPGRATVGGGVARGGPGLADRRLLLPLLAAVVVLAFGSRSYLIGHLPLVGQLLPVPSPTSLLGRFLGGWQDAGLQRPGPASPAFAMLGLAGLLFFGATSLVLKLLTIGCIVVGAWATSRLVGRLAAGPARVVAAIAYLFLPLAWNDLAAGDVQALVAYAAVPLVLRRLLDASGLGAGAAATRGGATPTGRLAATGSARPDRSWLTEALGLGVLLAVAGSFAPLVVILELAAALGLVLGCAVAGQVAGGLRALRVGSLAAGIAVVLTFPWSITFFQPGARASVLLGAAPAASSAPSAGALLRLDVGPIGQGVLGYALLAAALLVLLVGQRDRLAWGTRFWVVALGGFALAEAAGRGWLGAGGGAARLLLALPAACLAVCVGLGFESIASDLPGKGLGWRHAAAALLGVVGVAGLLPVVGASIGGRFGLPETGYDTVLSWIGPAAGPATSTGTGTGTAGASVSAPAASPSKVLWLGDPRALPLTAWQIRPGLAAGVSSGGLPNLTGLWPSSDPGSAGPILAGVVSAQRGLTVRLGALLARDGVRYVVVPTAVAPVLAGAQLANAAPPPPSLLAGLASQQDLHQLPSEGGIYVFESTDWRPVAAGFAPPVGGGTPAPLRSLAVGLELILFAAALVELRRLRHRSRHLLRALHHHRRQDGPGPEGGEGKLSPEDGSPGGLLDHKPVEAVLAVPGAGVP